MQLTGTVDWHYQRSAAEAIVRKLTGIRGVTNFIKIREQATAPNVTKKIEEALECNAELEARNIHVTVKGATRSRWKATCIRGRSASLRSEALGRRRAFVRSRIASLLD